MVQVQEPRWRLGWAQAHLQHGVGKAANSGLKWHVAPRHRVWSQGRPIRSSGALYCLPTHLGVLVWAMELGWGPWSQLWRVNCMSHEESQKGKGDWRADQGAWDWYDLQAGFTLTHRHSPTQLSAWRGCLGVVMSQVHPGSPIRRHDSSRSPRSI